MGWLKVMKVSGYLTLSVIMLIVVVFRKAAEI
jgi:hypothetical protein